MMVNGMVVRSNNWFKAIWGVFPPDRWTDRWTDEQALVIIKLLLWLKRHFSLEHAQNLCMMQYCLEPLKLYGSGKYNLNAIKEISVTSSYLGLSPSIRGCQNKESLEECTTELHKKSIMNKCKCLPSHFSNGSQKVCLTFNS